jgi:hypothetical protein
VSLAGELEMNLQHPHQVRNLVTIRVNGFEDDRRARSQVGDVEDLFDPLARFGVCRALAQNGLQMRQRAGRVP